MTFKEVQEYIRGLATRHHARDSEYEELELAAFREILRFALAEGWSDDPEVINKTLFGVDYDEEAEEDDEYTTWHYMELLLDKFDAQLLAGQLPSQTAMLYKFWKNEFWGSDGDDKA